MIARTSTPHHDEQFLAHLTEIAYQALLRRGLQRPFIDVELELWDEIRSAYHNDLASRERQRPEFEDASKMLEALEVA
jgi:hypothetical protein